MNNTVFKVVGTKWGDEVMIKQINAVGCVAGDCFESFFISIALSQHELRCLLTASVRNGGGNTAAWIARIHARVNSRIKCIAVGRNAVNADNASYATAAAAEKRRS